MRKYFLILILICFLLFFSGSVNTTWFSNYSGWSYRQSILIQNTAGNQTNYQVRIDLNSSNAGSHLNWTNNGSDIRFSYYNSTNREETALFYWIELWNSTSQEAITWINVSFLENNTNTTVYMYYGNSDVSSVSNVNNTFIRVIDDIRASWNFEEGGNSTTVTEEETNSGIGVPSFLGNLTNKRILALAENGYVIFVYEQSEHKITIVEVGDNSATFLIESMPINFILNVGESKTIDLDNDGETEIKLTLTKIFNGNAYFILEPYKELISGEVPETEEEEIEKEWNFMLVVVLLILVIVIIVANKIKSKKKK